MSAGIFFVMKKQRLELLYNMRSTNSLIYFDAYLKRKIAYSKDINCATGRLPAKINHMVIHSGCRFRSCTHLFQDVYSFVKKFSKCRGGTDHQKFCDGN